MGDIRLSKRLSIINYGLFVMTLTHALTHVFRRLYTASFPMLREEFSLTIQQLGVFAAIPPLCQILLSIPIGIITDKVGSKKMLLISLIFAIFGSLLAASTSNILMLVIAVSLIYLNTTIYHPASYSFTTKLFKRTSRPKALGIHGAGANIGVALGPFTLSLFIALGLTWRHVYLFWTFPIALSVLFVLRIDEVYDDIENKAGETVEPEPGEATSLFTRSLLMFLIYQGTRTIANQMIGTFMPLYIIDEKGFTLEYMGLLVGSFSLMGFLAAPVGGYMAARFSSKRWLMFSIALSLIPLGLIPITPAASLFAILYLAYGFSGTLGMASRSDLIAKLTPRAQRGFGYALLFLPGSIMSAMSPVIAAHLIASFGMGSLFPTSIIMSLTSLAVLGLGVTYAADPQRSRPHTGTSSTTPK